MRRPLLQRFIGCLVHVLATWLLAGSLPGTCLVFVWLKSCKKHVKPSLDRPGMRLACEAFHFGRLGELPGPNWMPGQAEKLKSQAHSRQHFCPGMQPRTATKLALKVICEALAINP